MAFQRQTQLNLCHLFTFTELTTAYTLKILIVPRYNSCWCLLCVQSLNKATLFVFLSFFDTFWKTSKRRPVSSILICRIYRSSNNVKFTETADHGRCFESAMQDFPPLSVVYFFIQNLTPRQVCKPGRGKNILYKCTVSQTWQCINVLFSSPER